MPSRDVTRTCVSLLNDDVCVRVSMRAARSHGDKEGRLESTEGQAFESRTSQRQNNYNNKKMPQSRL